MVYITQVKKIIRRIVVQKNQDQIQNMISPSLIRIKVNTICRDMMMYITQTTLPSHHKLCDVKQTGLRKVRLRDNIRIKSEIETTTNSPISCLKHQFLAVFYSMLLYITI